MSWPRVKLQAVCRIEKGITGINKAIPGIYPMVVTSEERKSNNEYQFDDDAVIIPLVSSTGHGHKSLKRIHFQQGKFALGSILCAVIPKDKSILSAEYLYRFLDLNKENELVARMKGMANVTLPMKEIAQIEIAIPPMAQQIEFTKKYNQLENNSESISSEFTHQLDLLKKLRQQILQDAVQGKLVPQDAGDEPARVLLERIKADKEQLVREKKIKKEKPLPAIKLEEIPFEIPENWVWCRLGDICKKITDGTHHSPQNLETGEIKYVTAKNIKDSGIDLTNITYISLDTHQEIYSRCNPEYGDLLFIKDGATTGIVTINNLHEQFSLLSSVALMKLPTGIINKYLMYALRSPFFYNSTRNDMFGVAITRVTLEKIQTALIPIPSLLEQNRIAAKVEQLMALCDELEQSIKQNQAYTRQLLQVALKEALEPESRSQ
jgi:type I restriction enzyme S subunit